MAFGAGLKRLWRTRAVRGLAWTLVVVLVAAAINAVGIHALGDVRHWQQWLSAHRGGFLAWRLCLYAGTGYGWWRMRRRLRAREAAPEAVRHLQRTEFAAVLAIVLLEASTWLTQG